MLRELSSRLRLFSTIHQKRRLTDAQLAQRLAERASLGCVQLKCFHHHQLAIGKLDASAERNAPSSFFGGN